MKINPLFAIVSASMFAVSAQAADLLDIYRSAQSNDPVFASQRAAQQAGQEKLPQGRSLLLPSVNLTANSTLNDLTTQY